MKTICPDCGIVKLGEGKTVDRVESDILTIACDDCHKIRQAKIKEINSRYPSAEQSGLEGSNQIPYLWCHRPNSSGKRIFHKTDHLGG